MRTFTLLRGLGFVLAVAVMAGCATAPTQEMSDARQAVQAARDAGASVHTPVVMNSAEKDLSEAEHRLRKRDYKIARDEAIMARQEAIKARNMALAITQAKDAIAEANKLGALTQETRDLMAQAETAADGGNEEEVVRVAQQAKQRAQEDIQRYREAQSLAERENQLWLDRTQLLLDEARPVASRLTGDQQETLRQAEEAYQRHEGHKAYDLVNSIIPAVRALPPLSSAPSEHSTTSSRSSSTPRSPPGIQVYQVLKGDNLWDIAAKQGIYGDPKLWPLIYLSNHQQVPDADLLKPGQTLTIELEPASELVKLAEQHERRREGGPDKVKELDQQFLRSAQERGRFQVN